MEVAVENSDVSTPKRWMPSTVLRIFEPEEVQKVVLEILQEGNPKMKCRATFILRWIGFSTSARMEGEKAVRFVEEFVWNGRYYESRPSEIPIAVFKERANQLRRKRCKVLLEEFEKTDNLVVRYHFSYLLEGVVAAYPKELQSKAQRIIDVISAEGFPMGAVALEKAIEGNEEWEELLYEGLGWRRR